MPAITTSGNEPTPETLKAYRARFGPDYYSFRHGRIHGIVLDTSVISAPGKVQADADAQEAWLKAELARAGASNARHVVIFQHHSWFIEKPDEPSQYFNVPIEARRRYLDLLKSSGVRYVFARALPPERVRTRRHTRDDYQRASRPSAWRRPFGLRIVTVKDDVLEHAYYGMGLIPNKFPIPPPAARRNP